MQIHACLLALVLLGLQAGCGDSLESATPETDPDVEASPSVLSTTPEDLDEGELFDEVLEPWASDFRVVSLSRNRERLENSGFEVSDRFVIELSNQVFSKKTVAGRQFLATAARIVNSTEHDVSELTYSIQIFDPALENVIYTDDGGKKIPGGVAAGQTRDWQVLFSPRSEAVRTLREVPGSVCILRAMILHDGSGRQVTDPVLSMYKIEGLRRDIASIQTKYEFESEDMDWLTRFIEEFDRESLVRATRQRAAIFGI